MSKFTDGFIHGVGVCRIQSVVQVQDSEICKVDVLFMGGELTINVPRRMLVDDKGVRIFRDDDLVFVDLRLGIQSNVKSFNGASYSKIDITVKNVVEFRKLTAEEYKAI